MSNLHKTKIIKQEHKTDYSQIKIILIHIKRVMNIKQVKYNN